MLVSVHVSARFSSTFEHAQRAARRLGIEDQVIFIDSGFAGSGLAEVVLEAARLARQGATADEVVAAVERIRADIFGVLSPTTGAWGGDKGWLTGLGERRHLALGHRRLVAMAPGRLEPLGWERESNVPRALAAALRKQFGQRSLLVAIAYGGADSEQLALLRGAMEDAGLQIVHGRMQLVGPALGARLGAGAATVFARPAGN